MIKKELIIHNSVEKDLITIALLEDGGLEEINRVDSNGGFAVGDIYLGKVRKLMSGLNAGFVSIGSEKDAFIHYLDLGSNYKSFARLLDTLNHRPVFSFADFPKQKEILRDGAINDVLSAGDVVLVQVSKESINTKGPRVTTDISLTGRHVVLKPFEKRVSISQKIKSVEERSRLKDIVRDIIPLNYGVIIRTASIDATFEDIQQDIKELVGKWQAILAKVATSKAPALVASENNRVMTILRDILSDSFNSIVFDDQLLYQEVKEYIKRISPEQEKIVKLHRSDAPIFDTYDVTRQIKGLFGKIVPFKRKSYMIIEQTEALHVIDINSGPKVTKSDNQESVAFEVNCNAVEQIARQLRLRDLGGIIVIDFIDMHNAENRSTLFKMMREAMSKDRAKHTILPLTKFCLMQITRQRVRQATTIENTEACPACKGTGSIRSSVLFDSEIESQIASIVENNKLNYLLVKLHPFVAAYFNEGLISRRLKLMWKHKIKLKIQRNESIGYIDAKYYDKKGNLLSLDAENVSSDKTNEDIANE